MSNQPSLNIYYVFFALLGVATLVAFGIAFWQDVHPEWITYQKAYYEEKYEDVKIKYEQAGNEKEKAKWKKRLIAFKNPKYEIKQILLDNAKNVDRCVTCHLDESSLKQTHPRSKQFPFRKFGCTSCHGGDGRATTFKKAHAEIRMDKEAKLGKYLSMRTHSVIFRGSLDLVKFWTTGERIQYLGSKVCIKCHISRNRRHVERWRKAKFNTFDRIKEGLERFDQQEKKPVEIRPTEQQCYPCHATGFDPEEKEIAEKGVTCEACHGPGGIYAAELMASKRAAEGAKIARANILEITVEKVCGGCHTPTMHDMLIGREVMAGVVSTRTGGRIIIDGKGDEAAWKWAMPKEIQTEDGPKILLKTLYDQERVYFLASWPDETPSKSSLTWVHREDKWELHQAGQDGLAIFWPIRDSVSNFDQTGCGVICHDSGRFAKSKRMFTNGKEELADRWLWRPILSEVGDRLSDGYLDSTVKRDRRGAHKDDSTGLKFTAGYGEMVMKENSVEVNGTKRPYLMPKDPGSPVVVLLEKQGVEIDWDKVDFPSGTQLPGVLVTSKMEGDSADIQGKGVWEDGMWTLEFTRKLVTTSEKDVQFDDLKKVSYFGIAIFDNAEGDDREKHTRSDLNPFSFSFP
jgi:hypothetical protein